MPSLPSHKSLSLAFYRDSLVSAIILLVPGDPYTFKEANFFATSPGFS